MWNYPSIEFLVAHNSFSNPVGPTSIVFSPFIHGLVVLIRSQDKFCGGCGEIVHVSLEISQTGKCCDWGAICQKACAIIR